MTIIKANGIDIGYQVSGSGDPLLLIMGLGGQLTDWHPGLVESLERHFTVIRFDNRDTGLSTYSTAPKPTRWELIKAAVRPRSVRAPYELADMTRDTAALLEALHIERAHVVGMSMGGMIAQSLAISFPQRVLSLCSIMSNTGDRRNGRPSAKVLASVARRPGEPGRDEALETTMRLFALIGGPDWDPHEQRRRSRASIERAFNPAGILRQSLAIAVTPDRTEPLGSVSAPTLVVHGLDDPLVKPSGGIATAKAIPGSRLLLYPHMGHDIPATRHAEMVAAIRTNADRAMIGSPRSAAVS